MLVHAAFPGLRPLTLAGHPGKDQGVRTVCSIITACLLGGCASESTVEGDGAGSTASTGAGTTGQETEGQSSDPDLEVDVLVIGSGPAGLSAAWEASRAGVSVLVVERDEALGGSGYYARHLIAAGTRWQVDQAIYDTPDQLLIEWPEFTAGGDAQDPWVVALAFESAGIVNWLVDDMGAQVEELRVDTAAGRTMRVHVVGHGELGPVAGLVDELESLTWPSVEALSLRVDETEPGRVAGAWLEDLRTGESVEVAAAATVIATGGFARDLERVEAVRPELAGATVVFEARLSSDGGGHHLLEQAGALLQNTEHHGIYLHSVPDPRPGLVDEAIVLDRLETSLMVDQDGQRVANEATSSGFTLSAVLQEAPDQRLWAILPGAVFDDSTLATMGPALGVAEANALSPADLVDLGIAVRATDAATLSAATGIDETGLQTTLLRYAELVASGEDPEFGKTAAGLVALAGDMVVVELAAGSAKSFGGAWLDEDARVLDADGQVIPGLFAAGEAAGMLGTPAVGAGFSGSVTACYLTGRVAGRNAAAEAQSP